MITNKLHDVNCIEFSDAIDSYGQRRKTVATTSTIQMAIYPFSNSEVDDIRFREVTNLGLTKAIVDDSKEIQDGDVTYLVKYVIPSYRYNQIFLRKK